MNIIFDILKDQIKGELDENVEKFGVKTKNLFIEDNSDLSIKLVLIPDTLVDLEEIWLC